MMENQRNYILTLILTIIVISILYFLYIEIKNSIRFNLFKSGFKIFKKGLKLFFKIRNK